MLEVGSRQWSDARLRHTIINVPPNHAFNQTRRYGPASWLSVVAAGRLTWSCWASRPALSAYDRIAHTACAMAATIAAKS